MIKISTCSRSDVLCKWYKTPFGNNEGLKNFTIAKGNTIDHECLSKSQEVAIYRIISITGSRVMLTLSE
jgi:hypothetical protein